MLPGERFINWLDKVGPLFADRLGTWTGKAIGSGIDAFAKILGKSAAPKLKPLIDLIEKTGKVPPELKPLLDEMKEPTGEVGAIFSQSAGSALIGGAIGKILDAILLPIAYAVNSVTRNVEISVAQMLSLWHRGTWSPGELDKKLSWLGVPKDNVPLLKDLSRIRLDPMSVITAWRRDPATYEQWFKDLKDMGWSDERIEALKFATEAYPALADVIRFYAKEAFEPDMIARYGLEDEMPPYPGTLFEKLGVPAEIARLYWIAHWEHASWTQVVEMLRRTDFTEADMREWFRVVEIPPFWRDKLIEISYAVPTRVDVRRWWDMRTISEERLREIYVHQGYHGEDLEDYIRWTKVFTDFPMMIARWRNGWIQEQDVRDWLAGLDIPAERIDHFIEEKLKAEQPERTTKERDLTKTDIYKGIKADRITRAEGAELLMDLGFDEDEADVLLDTNVPEDVTDKVVKQRQLTKTDIKAALKEDLLTPSQAVDKLMVLRYSRADADFLVKLFEHLIPIAEIEPQRELAKGDIARGLSRGILSPREARGMLLELRYSEEDADYLVSINMPAAEVVAEEKERQLAKTDIKSAFKVGLITADEAITRLEGIGYSPDDARFLVSIYQAIAQLVPITKPREASKADVVEAVKRGLLTAEEGYTMLIELDFTPEAATFILEVRAEVSPFSPINFTEFKERTGKLRKAAGMEKVEMPEEVKTAAAEVVTLTGEVEALERSITEEKRGLIEGEPIPEAATKRLKTLQVKRNRAISTLEKAKSDYDRLVAEWKHGLP